MFILGIGLFLLLQVVFAVILGFLIPVAELLVVSPIVSYTMVGLLMVCLLYLKPRLTAIFKEAEQGGVRSWSLSGLNASFLIREASQAR